MGSCSCKGKARTQMVSSSLSEDLDYGFSDTELKFLKLLFGELCVRNNSRKCLEKSTFLVFAPIPGVLGERFFDFFDTDRDGYINLNQFLTVLSMFSKNTVNDQLNTLFSICCMQNDQMIKKKDFCQIFFILLNEILTDFNSMPKEKHNNVNTTIEINTHPCSFASAKDDIFYKKKKVTEVVEAIFKKYSQCGEKLKKTEFFEFILGQNWILSKVKEWLKVDIWTNGLQMKLKFSEKFNFNTGPRVSLAPAKVFVKGKWNKVFLYVKDMFLLVLNESKDVQEVYFVEGCKFHAEKECLKLVYNTQVDERIFFIVQSEELCKKLGDTLNEVAGVRYFENYYKIGELIGSGKFSLVHRCIKLSTGEKFTVKVIKKHKHDRAEREMIRKEILILNHARSSGIISLKDSFDSHKSYKLIMEYIECTDLLKKITSEEPNESTVKQVIKKILLTVKFLHSIGIIHRDLKPENILVYEKNDEMQIKIIDFGLSTFFVPGKLKKYKCGTLGYMAPEILSGKYDEKVDLWSVGIIVFAYLTKKLPFFSESREEIFHMTQNTEPEFDMKYWGKYSKEAMEFTKLMLSKNPQDRPDCSTALMHRWLNDSML